MNRTRWLIGLSVLTLLILVLVACQSTPAPTAQPTESPSAEEEAGEVATTQPTEEPLAEATPVPEEKITLTVWDFGGTEFGFMDSIVIPAYQELHPEIVINHVGIPEEDLGLKLETAIAAGEVPDLAVFVPNRVVKAGHILFLDAYMERDGLARSDYCRLFQSNNILDDKVFALPIDTNIWAMMYNKDLFAAAGLPEPGPEDIVTYDDWLTYARAINKPADTLEERVWGSMFFWPQWNSMGCGTPNYILGDDGRTCAPNAESEEWLHFWELMLAAYNEDLTTETAGAMLADIEEDLFLQGKVGMTYAALGDAIYAKQNGINVGLTAQPVLVEGWDGGVGGWNTNYSILAASKHPDEAWEFLKWLSTESPKIIPIGTDALDSAGGGLPGLPCYLPLLEEPKIAQMIAEEPLVADGVKLMERVKTMPFSPDPWTSTEPFYEAWRRITEDDVPIVVAIHDAALECQEVTDQLWSDWDALAQ